MANILSQIKRAVVGAAKYVGGFRTTFTRFWSFGNKEVYSPIEQDNAIKNGFNSNAAVYAITKKYAKKAASIERYLESKADESEMEDHPLMQLLNRPNDNQSHYSLFKTLYCFYKICGEGFLWLNRGDVGQMVNEVGELVDRTDKEYQAQPVIEMFNIPPNEITVVVEEEDPNKVIGYFLQNNPTVKFGKFDMIHWKDVNLEWDELGRPQLRGMSPLKPGSKILAADNSFIESMLRMAQNDGSKAIAFNKSMAQLSPKQETQLEDVFSDKINNKNRKNSVAALQGDWGLLNLGLTAVDMDTINAREFIYKEMCFLLDVPYGFFDSHTPYAEKQLAARDWISNSIRPDILELDGELNRLLLPAFGLAVIGFNGILLSQKAKICSDFDSLPELQQDKAKMMEWLNKAPLTGNQRLEALEYEKSTDPAMEIVTSSELMYPMDKYEQDMQAAENMAANTDPNNPTDAYP